MCPEGKEWKVESKLKKLNNSFAAWLGLDLPTMCLTICVRRPVVRVAENMKKELTNAFL